MGTTAAFHTSPRLHGESASYIAFSFPQFPHKTILVFSTVCISCLDTHDNGMLFCPCSELLEGALNVVTLTLIGQAPQMIEPLGSNPRRSWCAALSVDTFILGRPHTYHPATLVSGGGTT